MTEQSDRKEADQAAKDAAVKAAFEAWHRPPRDRGPEDTDALWEAMWETCDFSWEGLADAGWERGDKANEAQKLKRWRAPANFPGGGTIHGEGEAAWKEATLQDYWRWSLGFEGDARGERLLSDRELEEAGLLVSGADGALWHRLHLRPDAVLDPDTGLDEDSPVADMRSAAPGEGAEKNGAGGGGLTPMLLARLVAGFETEGYGPEGSLRLIGSRAHGLDAILRAYAAPDAEDVDDRPGIYLDARCAALHDFDVRGAQFHGTTLFDSAQFRGLARFESTQFRGLARFESTQFRGRAGFGSAQFLDEAGFDSAQFRGEAWFGQVQFRGEALFDSAQFRGAARFDGAQFLDEALFENAQFRGQAGFSSAQFRDTALFESTQFRGTAWFGSAQFSGHAWFDSVQFCGRAGFGSALFRSEAWFGRVQFRGEALFNSAQFRGMARFVDAAFLANAAAGSVRFRTAQFFRRADFSGCQFPNQPERIQGAFETARFLEEARFRTPELMAFSAFDGAVFKGKLLLAAAGTEREEQSRFDAVLRATDAAVEEDRRIMSAADYDPAKDEQPKERGANTRFAALEGGLRVLKTAMEAEKDHMQEHRFFRFELQAKRRRPSVSRLEKAASWSYGLLSDYGNSMGRPLAALALSVLFFWVVYWGWGLSVDGTFLGVEKERTALEFSIRNVVQPFGPWTATSWSPLFNLEIVKIVSCGGPAEKACPTGGGFGWLVFRLLATVQSVFSLLLAFLFALALRKKFQIS
mgnify:CR=1 FL=1